MNASTIGWQSSIAASSGSLPHTSRQRGRSNTQRSHDVGTANLDPHIDLVHGVSPKRKNARFSPCARILYDKNGLSLI
jgi:hypothetical protein